MITNCELFTNSVTVNTTWENRRVQYDIGIGYSDDIEQAKQLIKEAIVNLEGILKDPAPDVLVMELAGSSVNLRVRWWINPPRRSEALDTRDKVLTAIKNKLIVNGIDLPFPTQQILFHDQTEDTDGDRSSQREGWPAGNNDVPNSRSISGSLKKLVEKQAQKDGNGNGNG